MDWAPDLSTREEIRGFVQDLLATLPNQLGIDEIIAGCQVLTFPAGAPPKYIDVALGGDAGPPQTGYTQAVLYRGGITGLGVGSYVAVIHLREGNRYEVLMLSGPAGAAVDPAPADAEYVTMALDGRLTDERVLTAGDWLALTDGGAGGLATLNFEPDLPIVISAGGVLTEYATIQAAITAAVVCETVLVPPGTYAEDITLKDGVCVKGFGPRDKIRITGDEDVVTTAAGGWLENVTIVATDPPAAAIRQAVDFAHAAGTCHLRAVTIVASSTVNAQMMCAINSTGAGSGLLVLDDIEMDVSTTVLTSAACGIRVDDAYELDLKNFKMTVACSGGGAGDDAWGIVQTSSAVVKATEGWLDVTATGAGTATDLFGTITYSEIVDTSNDTLFGQNVWLLDGNAIGIDGNERLIFNAAGNATFTGVTSVVVPNGAWVGADAACSWVFDSTAGDVTTQDNVGIKIGLTATLHLDGAGVASGIKLTRGTLVSQWFGANDGPAYFGCESNDDLHIRTNAANRVTILASGNVGIRTTGPNFRLDVDMGAGIVPAINIIGSTDASFTSRATMGFDLNAALNQGFILGAGYGDDTQDFYLYDLYDGALRLIVDTSGYMGVNVAPAFRFDVLDDRANTFAAQIKNDGNNVNRYGLNVQCGGTGAAVGTTYFFYATDGRRPTGNLKTVNGLFQLADTSDERLKTNIEDTKINGLDIINQLKVRDFTWKANPDSPVMTSFVAQEAQKVYPDMVGPALDGTLMTSRAMLIPVLTKAIQELNARLTQLEAN